MLSAIHTFAFWFGLGVDIIGAIVLLSRIVLKLIPNPKQPDGGYRQFYTTLKSTSLYLGNLESEI